MRGATHCAKPDSALQSLKLFQLTFIFFFTFNPQIETLGFLKMGVFSKRTLLHHIDTTVAPLLARFVNMFPVTALYTDNINVSQSEFIYRALYNTQGDQSAFQLKTNSKIRK